MGSGAVITPLRLIKKVAPNYTPQAKKDRIQGTVLLRVLITKEGRLSNITVVSPLGHGLDEEAIAAAKRWEYEPPTKNGEPLAVLTTLEIRFRLDGIPFDELHEQQRTHFNSTLQILGVAAAGSRAAMAAINMQTLAEQDFPPAMYLMGQWETHGSGVPKNPQAGISRMRKAAARNYAPALHSLAVLEIEGTEVPADPEHGMKLMQQAADGGSTGAQMYLGDVYQKGKGVAVQPDQARRYFRLCAGQGEATCQFRLGTMLMDAAAGSDRDRVQAVAWLELAAATLPEAREVAAREAAALTPDQNRAVASLKSRLVHQ